MHLPSIKTHQFTRTVTNYLNAGMVFLLLLPGCTDSATEARQQSDENTVSVAGASLFVKTLGEGAPLLFVHGGPGLDHSYFLPHVRPLAESNTLVFYDQRSSGRSGIGEPTAFSMEQFIADLDRVRASTGVEKVHLLAHSWGGLIAMQYALSYPGRLNSLILVNPNAASAAIQQDVLERLQARVTPFRKAEQAALLQTEAFHRRDPAALTDFFRLNFKSSFYDTTKVEQLSFYFDSTFTRKSTALGQLRADSTLTAYDLYASLQTLDIPTLILHGSHDPSSPEEIALLQEAIPHSRLVQMDSSGHFPFIEQPELFSYHIQTFLTNLAG